jgi:hypothetical protein
MLLFRVTVVETKRVLGKAAPVRDKRIAETPVDEFIQFCVYDSKLEKQNVIPCTISVSCWTHQTLEYGPCLSETWVV